MDIDVPDHVDRKLGVFDNPIYSGNKSDEHLKSIRGEDGMVDVNHHLLHGRKKRGAPLLVIAAIGAGLFVLGSSIYSWVSMKQLSDRISKIEQDNEKIEEAIKEMFGVLHEFRKADDDMYHAIRKIIPELARHAQRTDCEVFRTKLDLFVSYAYRTREAIIRVLNAALVGSVTTEMITAYELRNVLLASPEFDQSVYRDDLDLFYKLSMAIPLAYNTNTLIISSYSNSYGNSWRCIPNLYDQ